MKFTLRHLGPGVRLHLCETDKFKSLTCKIFIQQDLKGKEATSTALLPLLLRRGSQKFPSTLHIARELEALYAAEFASDILKIGERQILEFHFQMVDPRLLPKAKHQLQRGLKAFWEIATRPAGPQDRFLDSFFEQEKQTLEQDLKGLVNDKRSYALARAMALMCTGEPFGIYKYGDLETLQHVENHDVYHHYQQLLSAYPTDIFCVGSHLEDVVDLVISLIPPRRGTVELEPIQVVQAGEPRSFAETMDLQQAVVVMGYRTNCSYLDEDYYALLVANGILGGFAHSKLFLNVREKASLAYYVGSSIEGSKGLLTITAGISGDKEEQALEIIKDQVDAMQAGQITAEELKQTKQGIINAMTSVNDNPSGIIDRNLIGIAHGQMRTVAQVVEAIQKVEQDDCVRAMKKIQLDTTYVLRPRFQEGANHGEN
ncbi:MAG TPA: peptidase M16 [Firmicutes bacterium]|nr:peptidase M16 [Bacillota bacterium]